MPKVVLVCLFFSRETNLFTLLVFFFLFIFFFFLEFIKVDHQRKRIVSLAHQSARVPRNIPWTFR